VARAVLKGPDFSRAVSSTKPGPAPIRRNYQAAVTAPLPSGAEAHVISSTLTARLEVVPFPEQMSTAFNLVSHITINNSGPSTTMPTNLSAAHEIQQSLPD
jgi:hypothetical protein